jgi:hypothetical protein
MSLPHELQETDEAFWSWFLKVDKPSSKGRTWVTPQTTSYMRKFSGTVREDGVLRLDNAVVPEFWIEVQMPAWVQCAADMLPMEVPEACVVGRLGEAAQPGISYAYNHEPRVSERPSLHLRYDQRGNIRIDDTNCPPFYVEIRGTPVIELMNCALAAYHHPDRIFKATAVDK